MLEEWVMVDVAAKVGTNVDQLLEMLLLVAEMQELKADPTAKPEGTVIEANLDKGKGPVATIIVQNGTLRRGSIIHTNTAWGKIRAMIDDKGRNVNEAGPSMPVEILGLESVPQPGEKFSTLNSEREARDIMRSTHCVEIVKHIFGKKTRVGHGGTLDSTASGLLLILLGSATRLSDFVMDMAEGARLLSG